MTEPPVAWPAEVFAAPMLRGLDLNGRARLSAAGKLLEFGDGAAIYREGAEADAMFVVTRGQVALRSIKRGDQGEAVVRVANAGDTFGEEATLGLRRRTTASASGRAQVAEIPAALLRRTAARTETLALVEREERILQRSVTTDLLRTLALTRDLPPEDLDIVLDALAYRTVVRGERIYAPGDPAAEAFLVAEGLVQLQDEADVTARPLVRAYLSAGDMFGDDEALTGVPRVGAAVAMGPAALLRLPATVLRTLADRNRGLLRRARRVPPGLRVVPETPGPASPRMTAHVFKDLYRLDVARSLLVIDQDSCVRCGHCTWSCAAVHDGVPRLARRGDKIVTSVAKLGEGARALLLPSSCQHCKNPACMIDCPTGAIGREASGEVFIREELCIGCGNCAKACPWDNIQMAPREGGQGSAEVAVKCDLCREFAGPACVQACPTGSIVRLDPRADVAEVAQLLGHAAPDEPVSEARRDVAARFRWPLLATVLAAAVIVSRLRHAGALRADGGWGWALGVLGAVGIFVLLGHAIPKRFPRLWLRHRVVDRSLRSDRSAQARSPRSRLRPLVRVHLAVSGVTMVAIVGHAGPSFGGQPGPLLAVFWATALLGVAGAVMYRVVPARLSRLEDVGALPEELREARGGLLDRIYRDTTGRGDRLKAVLATVVVPYLRDPLGPLRLALAGVSLREEQTRLFARIDARVKGRAHTIEGLEPLLRTAVGLRALAVRRAATVLLRGWLPLHIIASGMLVALLLMHMVAVGGRP